MRKIGVAEKNPEDTYKVFSVFSIIRYIFKLILVFNFLEIIVDICENYYRVDIGDKAPIMLFCLAIIILLSDFVKIMPQMEQMTVVAAYCHKIMKKENMIVLGERIEDHTPGLKYNHQQSNEWKCANCGRFNQEYVGVCACGNKKVDNK